MSHEEVKANKKVVKTTKELKLLQTQELKASNEKKKEKATLKKSECERYKHMMELFRKHGDFIDGLHWISLPPKGVSSREGQVIETPKHGIFFTDTFNQPTQTLFIFKISKLTNMTPEALRLVKILEDEINKIDDKDFLLTKNMKLEPMGITEE
ncbi:hypothetical protein Tco_0445102 [Tanacetum coccineum]